MGSRFDARSEAASCVSLLNNKLETCTFSDKKLGWHSEYNITSVARTPLEP